MATTKTLTPTNQTITLAAFTEKPDNRINVTNDDRLADAVNALNSKIETDYLGKDVPIYGGDVDSLTTGFVYTSSEATNIPASGIWIIVTISYVNGAMQFAARRNSSTNILYFRHRNSSTWIAWSEIQFVS